MIWLACLIAAPGRLRCRQVSQAYRLPFFITENDLFSVIDTGQAIPRPAVAVTKPLAGEPGVTKLRVRYKVREN